MASDKSSTAATELTRLLECRICLDGLRNCHVCGHCTQPFCRDCIIDWIKKDRKCPNCRQILASPGRLLKVGTFDQIQDQLNQLLIDETQNRCGQHPKDPLVLYCQRCQKCICARCQHSDQHLDHKDEVVLLDAVYDLYENRLQCLMAKLENKKNVTIKELLDYIRDNLKTLTKLLNDDVQILETNLSTIEQLQHRVQTSLSAKKDATTLQTIMAIVASVESFVSEESQVSSDIENRLLTLSLPKPVNLKFQLDRDDEYCDDSGDVFSDPQTVDGFCWVVKLSSDGAVYLCLLEGTPGEYAIALGAEASEMVHFALGTFVLLREDAELEQSLEPDSVEVVIHVQQAKTFQEKSAQQERYIEQLKAKIAVGM